MDVATLDRLTAPAADDVVAPCCAARAWRAAVVDGRPYGDLAALLTASDAALAALTWDDVLEALAAHPRIGQRAEGQGTEARWSRAEQAAAATTDDDVATRLRAANVAYEQRFGHVFLIRASGRGPQEVLAEATRRLGNDDTAERVEVREQLRQIVALRLEKVFAP